MTCHDSRVLFLHLLFLLQWISLELGFNRCHALLVVQVTDLTGLEAGELRAKVGSNVMDNTVVSLTGTDIELAPHLRHAGMLSAYKSFCASHGTMAASALHMIIAASDVFNH